jgi:hypothetical protein
VSTSPSYQSEYRQSEYRVDDGHNGQEGQPISSVGQLMGEISADISRLMRQEVALAKTELTESVSKAGKGGGMLGGAAVAGHMVLVFLSVALWWSLGEAIGRGLSALVVAVIWGVIAAVLAVVGRNQLKAVDGLPKTAATAKKIPNALKGNEDGQ